MISCFRLSSRKYPAQSGLGAALNGGRWNPKGIEVIYAAATISLGALEVLVHFSVLPEDFVSTEIHIPAKLGIIAVEAKDLPRKWDAPKLSKVTQAIGRTWATERQSPVLSVPSAIVQSERNYVLNPDHPDFERIKFFPPRPFPFDTRLK